MDPGRFHHSRTVRLLWLGMPPIMLAAMSALALGYERLVHERLARLNAVAGVLPVMEKACREADAVTAPLKSRDTATADTEKLHERIVTMVHEAGLLLNSLAIDRHEEQPINGAARLKVAISLDGGLDEQARLLALMTEAEPLLIAEAARWTWLRTGDEAAEEYRGEFLFSLYRVKP